jgi:hypothetical protein
VEWEDAVAEAGPWVDRNSPPMTPKVFLQVGWLLEDTRDAIVLTHAVEPDGTGLVAARERIPRGMVRKIRALTPMGPVKKRRLLRDSVEQPSHIDQ